MLEPPRTLATPPTEPAAVAATVEELALGIEIEIPEWPVEPPFVALTSSGQATEWAGPVALHDSWTTDAPIPDLSAPSTESTQDNLATIIARRPAQTRSRRPRSRPVAAPPRDRMEEAEAGTEVESELEPSIDPEPVRSSTADAKRTSGSRLPTAREILNLHQARRAQPDRASDATSRPKPRRARKVSEPQQTVARLPELWSIPLWLGAPTLATGALGFAIVGLALGWSWSIEAEHSGFVVNRIAGITRAEPPVTR